MNNYPPTDARHYCPRCHGERTSPVWDITKCFVCGGSGLAKPDVTPTAEWFKPKEQRP